MKSGFLILVIAFSLITLFSGCTISSDAQIGCTEEAKICPDGSAVGRVGLNCEFAPCPQVVGGDKDEHGCIPSAGYSWCEEKQKCLRVWEEECSVDSGVVCTMDAKLCSDGSYVGRVAPDCNFAPCPSEETLIPKNCTSWYDGCNTCGVENGELTFCTLMYCETPAEPYCKTYANEEEIGVEIANPASTNCIDNNGVLEILDTNEGQVGMCTFPSGKVCEEWAYYNGTCED